LRADPGRERVELEMEIFELSKVLAKIAYCQSIKIFGPYAIRPFVTDIIAAERGQSPSFLEFVGGAFVEEFPIEQLTISHLGKCQVRLEIIDDKFIVLARVQIIGLFDTPVYEVVVGELMARSPQPTIYVPTPIQPVKTYRELEIESMNLIMALKEHRMSANA